MSDKQHQTTRPVPIALTIAGSDSGGGAGIQADIKTFSALGVFGASVITAVTAQNTLAVTDVHDIPEHVVRAQILAVLDDLNIQAVKIGMLSSPAIIHAVTESLAMRDLPVVLDPVMVAKSGDSLLQESAVDALIAKLLPSATVVTPNLPEAARLLGEPEAADVDDMVRQGESLLEFGADWVLIKGGHAAGSTCTDVLTGISSDAQYFRAPRLDTRNTHGTGCTLSSGIAAGLAAGLPVADAVQRAHRYLHRAIECADQLQVGNGHGPVHHFHEVW